MLKKFHLLFSLFAVVIFFSFLSVAVAIALPIDKKTVLYMSFDKEPDKGFVEDESGYENHGNIIGQGAKWTKSGRFEGALELDGASKIEIPHSESLNLGKEMTLEIWFKTAIPQKGRFLIYKINLGAGRNYQWGIYLTGDSTTVSMYGVKPDDEVKFVSKAGDYKDDGWHFLAGTYNSKTMTCFIDSEIVSENWPGEMRTGEGMVVIGTWTTNFFTGTLDEARICNVALSEEQLKSDYENGYNIMAVSSYNKLSTIWGEIKSK